MSLALSKPLAWLIVAALVIAFGSALPFLWLSDQVTLWMNPERREREKREKEYWERVRVESQGGERA